ncbi:hypothetical protein C8J57DRAFT_996014, partial [Mycena rebaudengoi]
PRCQIVVDGVPTTFNPSSPDAPHTIYAHNNAAISDPSCITEVRWINPKALKIPGKKASSLLITFSDPLSADLCIAQGVAVESMICYAHRYKEPPPQCYNCQGYSHMQSACKEKGPTCARCAGPHCTSAC